MTVGTSNCILNQTKPNNKCSTPQLHNSRTLIHLSTAHCHRKDKAVIEISRFHAFLGTNQPITTLDI